MNKPIKYYCPKCGSKTCKTGEVRVAGGFFTSLFNIQYKHFTTLTCTECMYTELYNLPSKDLTELFDIHKDI
jgi:uncharacterized protein